MLITIMQGGWKESAVLLLNSLHETKLFEINMKEMIQLKKIITLILIFVTLSVPMTFAADNADPTVDYFDKVKDFAVQNYKFGVTDSEIYESALKEILKKNPEMLETALAGMAKSMDEYTRYLPKNDFESWMNSISGSFVGIGVTIEERNGYVTVISPLENSPAKKAGLLAGDKFVSVNGTDVTNKGVEYLRSLVLGEEGTEVTVGILRDGEADVLYFTMKRAKVEQGTVASSVLEDNIGYITINSFAETTFEELKKALNEFDEKSVKKLIIDLRDNPGGEVSAVVNTLGLFTPAGPVFHVEYKDSTKNEVYNSYNKNPGKYKLVVLVNENSASGAEAFSGSIKDTKSGIVVGKVTYGKGTVQTIQPLATGGAIKLTFATYSTAHKTQINHIGVIPDYIVRNEKSIFEEHPESKEMQFSMEINENSSKEAIEAIEQRLRMLSIYPGKQDGVWDEALTQAVKIFQEKNELEANGIINFDTQLALYNAAREIEVVIDRQFEKALELIKAQ